MWCNFHQHGTDPKGHLVSTWKELISDLEMSDESDGILMQAVFCQVFEKCFSENVTTITPAVSTLRETEVVLTVDELNALRYACGYVSHRLLKKFEKRKGDKFCQFIHCLGEMAVVGEGGDFWHIRTSS